MFPVSAVRRVELDRDASVATADESDQVRRGALLYRTVFGVEWRQVAAVSALALVDWVVVCSCLTVAVFLRRAILTIVPELGHPYPLRLYFNHLCYALPWLAVFAESGMYTRRVLMWDEVRMSLRACTVAAMLGIFLSFAVRYNDELSRLVISFMWMLTLVAVPIARYNAKRGLTALGLWTKRVIILGAGEVAESVYQRIQANPALGFRAVGFVDDDPNKWGTKKGDIPVYGPLSTAPQVIRRLGAKEVLIAMPQLSRSRLLHVVSTCEGYAQNIRIVPDLFGLATVGVETENLDGLLVLRMRWNLAKPWNLAFKRTFDCAMAVLTVAVTAPLLAVIALAIRRDSPGPAIFSQDRLGRSGRHFRCFKFRTMYVDNEERLRAYLADNPSARAEWEHFAKLKSCDPRVTRVGRLLRRFSLDELPQLFNVLAGDMSLVGPRPYLPRETEQMGEFASTILKAPPGITGLWQVTGRNELLFAERLRLDEYYVRNWSLWMDIMVLAKTFGVVYRGEGAY